MIEENQFTAATALTVYATSDLHAHWAGEDRGIARVLGSLTQRDTTTSVLIDNGDLLTGSPFGAFLADRVPSVSPHPILAELEHAGFDVWVPGNHDFDHGIGWLLSAVSDLSSLTVLCANCVDSEGELIFQASTVLHRGGLRVGVVGAVTGQVQRLGRYEAVRDVRFTDPVAAVEREVASLRAACDLVIVAYHGGFVVDPQSGAPMHYNTGEDQASRLLEISGIDGLIAGHQHWARSGVTHREDSTFVAYVQPGYAGALVGEMTFQGGETERASARLIEIAGAAPATGPLDELHGALDAWLAEESSHADNAIHRMVNTRMRGATALALPDQPRTLADLAASFRGVYGVSRLRLPADEYRAGLAAARDDGMCVSEIGVEADETDVEVVVNALLRGYFPAGRVEEDSVVNWLDEIVYAQRRGVLAP